MNDTRSAVETDWLPPVESGETPWPEPLQLDSELPPVESITQDLIPYSLRPLVFDVAERMQIPADFPAAIAILCLAGAVNRRAMVQPKAKDFSWIVVPNLWGGIIAPPGFMKSPVIAATTRPLVKIQAEWQREYTEDTKNYAHDKEEYDLRRTAWKEDYKTKTKKHQPLPKRPEGPPEEPKLRRLIVNDATFEALHQTMGENPAGILLIRDELTGWLSTLDRAGREGERAFCLQAWNGDTSHTIDRIGRGTIHVEACCMSLLGGIQPGRLRSYLMDALRDGPANDGLMQRFQLLVWPDLPEEWKYIDRPPLAAAEESASAVFRRLVELDPVDPLRFQFDADAQRLFAEWMSELESKLRNGDLCPALVCHLSKYRSLMPSLALLFELADRAAGGFDGFVGSYEREIQNFCISLEHAKQAAAFCEYLESHARRVYSCIVTPQMRSAQELSKKIKQRKIAKSGVFSSRDVYLKGWSGLDSPEAVRIAVEVLQDLGWVRSLPSEPSFTGGRPANRYLVNPGAWQ